MRARHPVDEQNALAVVVLVLDATGEQSFAFHRMRRTVGIAEAHDGSLYAFNFARDARKRETAFGVAVLFASRHGHVGVGQKHWHDLGRFDDFAVQQKRAFLIADI